MTLPGDLNLEQSRGIYSAFLAKSQTRSQLQVFGELGLTERRAVVKAIEVVEKHQKTLLQKPDDCNTHLTSDDKMLSLINRLKGSNPLLTNREMVAKLKQSRPLAIQGRAEMVMESAFLIQNEFLKAIEKPGGKLYLVLAKTASGSDKKLDKKQVVTVLQKWVEGLVPGERQKIAKEVLKQMEVRLASLTPEAGFFQSNLDDLVLGFKTEVETAIVKTYGDQVKLTSRDLQAMGIGSLDLLPFFGQPRVNEKKKEFVKLLSNIGNDILGAKAQLIKSNTPENAKNYSKVVKQALDELKAFEASVLPQARHPEWAVLYSKALGEHVRLIIDHSLAARKAELDHGIHPKGGDFKTFADGAIKRTGELKKLNSLYALYAAARGNGEGALSVAYDIIWFGDWVQGRDNTKKTAEFMLKVALDAATKSHDQTLLRQVGLLKANIRSEEYLSAVSIRKNGQHPELVEYFNFIKGQDEAINAYTTLGPVGMPGLYRLFVEGGIPADPLVDLLAARLGSKKGPRPTADEIKMLTTLALSGDTKASALLIQLGERFPIGPKSTKNSSELATANALITSGAYEEPQVGQDFSLEDANQAYADAALHIQNHVGELARNGMLKTKTLEDQRKKFNALKEKYQTFFENQTKVTKIEEVFSKTEEFLKATNPKMYRKEEDPTGAKAFLDTLNLEDVPFLAIPAHMTLGSKNVDILFRSPSLRGEIWTYLLNLLTSFSSLFSRREAVPVEAPPPVAVELPRWRAQGVERMDRPTGTMQQIARSEQFKTLMNDFRDYIEAPLSKKGEIKEKLYQDMETIAQTKGPDGQFSPSGLINLLYNYITGLEVEGLDTEVELSNLFPDDAEMLRDNREVILPILAVFVV